MDGCLTHDSAKVTVAQALATHVGCCGFTIGLLQRKSKPDKAGVWSGFLVFSGR